jgi:ribosomal protein L11 methyltransferase
MAPAEQDEPRFPVLRVLAPDGLADDVAYALIELGSKGVEQRDDSTIERGPGEGQVLLEASFGSDVEAQTASRGLADAWPQVVMIELGAIVGDAWREKYKEYFAPFPLSHGLTVVPPWVKYEATEDEQLLIMDPGRAFGTGLHATTSLVADQLVKHAAALGGQRVLDVGTGSGILALVAIRLGADGVDGFDIDPEAVSAARENAERNDLAERVRFWCGELDGVDKSYPVVVANIRTEVLLAQREALTVVVGSGGVLVLSGILASEEDAVRCVYCGDFDHVETTRRAAATGDRQEDAWVALVLRKRV